MHYCSNSLTISGFADTVDIEMCLKQPSYIRLCIIALTYSLLVALLILLI